MLMVELRGKNKDRICVNWPSECGDAAAGKRGRRDEMRCLRGVTERGKRKEERGGMWLARCEILRMTVLKLNMRDSNTITIK